VLYACNLFQLSLQLQGHKGVVISWQQLYMNDGHNSR
jgi:hypothetical protein